jgi:hypothetical protein
MSVHEAKNRRRRGQAIMKRPKWLFLSLLALVATTACAIDRSIYVRDNQENKPYRIIDGDLEVAAKGRIASGWVVDGNVLLDESSTVKGDISLTDGTFTMESGATVEGTVTLRHVDLDLRGGIIEGDVDLLCTGGRLLGTRIAGELRVRDKALWYKDCDRSTTLTLGPGTEIGRLRVETDRVEVVLEEGARVDMTVSDVASDGSR